MGESIDETGASDSGQAGWKASYIFCRYNESVLFKSGQRAAHARSTTVACEGEKSDSSIPVGPGGSRTRVP